MRPAVLLALTATACGRFGFSEAPEPDAGAPPDAPCAAPRWQVERIVDELTSTETDWSPAWGLGTRQIVFESDRDSGNYDLFLSSLDDKTGRYSAPRAIQELNSAMAEASPALSEDGLEIFFTVNGAIRRATRTSATARFGTATVLIENAFGPDLGSEDRDLVYSITENNRTVVMMRTRSKAGGTDFADPVRFDSVQFPSGGGWPSLSHDGLELFYEAGEDQPTHVARRLDRASQFAPAVPITELGAASDPDISPDGQQLLYVSMPQNYVMLARRTCADSR